MSVNRVLDTYQLTAKIDELEDKILELEAVIGQKSWYKKDIGTIIDSLEKEIAELREKIKGVNTDIESWKTKVFQIDFREDALREVLQKLINILIVDVNNELINEDRKEDLSKLLEKLDAPEKTEKKEDYEEWLNKKKKGCKHKDISSSSDPLIGYICHDCGTHLNSKFEEIPFKTFDDTIKASGGEIKKGDTVICDRDTGEILESKKPEPKMKDPWDDYETVFDPIKGTMVMRKKEDEPREDDVFPDENYEEWLRLVKETLQKKGLDVVKREKIDFWRRELLNKTDEVLKSMREVLGID